MLHFITHLLSPLLTPFGVLCLYIVPLLICIWHYSVLCVEMYRKDLKRRSDAEVSALPGYRDNYHPYLKMGHLLYWILLSFTPGINLLVTVFHHVWSMLANLVDYLARLVDIPLVPKRPRP